MAWLRPDTYVESPMAADSELLRFHDAGYVSALRRAEANLSVDTADRDRYRIGTDNNPVYAEMFCRPATSAGGCAAGDTADRRRRHRPCPRRRHAFTGGRIVLPASAT